LLKSIQISNYKTINKLNMSLGRINVFIGENGAGKSNILEAISLAGAAQARKLDNEFLASRGIRVTRPQFMRSALSGSDRDKEIVISAMHENGTNNTYRLQNDNGPYSTWTCETTTEGNSTLDLEEFLEAIGKYVRSLEKEKRSEFAQNFLKEFKDSLDAGAPSLSTDKPQIRRRRITVPLALTIPDEVGASLISGQDRSLNDFKTLENFVIYSPENSALRRFEMEGQIEPLGINGEGLFRLLTVMADTEPEELERIQTSLRLLGWFRQFSLTSTAKNGRMEIRDEFLDDDLPPFDHQSANEGFLFLAFYFALFTSRLTPNFFAIDNVDASLNPKLCRELVKELVELSKLHRKQAILTTHNPAALDGLNLDDDEQRLFVVSRGRDGQTKLKRVRKPQSWSSAEPLMLSEAFLSGALGGLPKSF
jgi:predicted ATPase